MARKTEPANKPPVPPASEEQVVAFLRAHPHFLVDHPDLLSKLAPPSRFNGGPVVDMQQFMIARLNDELDQMRGCAEHLISTSRSNMSIQSRTHQAILSTLCAGSMPALLGVIAEEFPRVLDIDIATIGFEPGDQPITTLTEVPTLPSGLVEELMGAGEVMLRASCAGHPAVFGDAAGLVASFALVRLTPVQRPVGLLALGSRNERTFHSSQGTDLLAFLARILEDCIDRWWPAD
jgi:uncharacterized protein